MYTKQKLNNNGGCIMAVKIDTVTIKVSPEEKQKIKALAEKEDVTVSKLLYKILKKEIFEEQ